MKHPWNVLYTRLYTRSYRKPEMKKAVIMNLTL